MPCLDLPNLGWTASQRHSATPPVPRQNWPCLFRHALPPQTVPSLTERASPRRACPAAPKLAATHLGLSRLPDHAEPCQNAPGRA